MKLKKSLEIFLFERGIINEKQLSKIKSTKEKTKEPVESILADMKIVSEEVILEVVGEELGIPFLDLKNYIIDPEVLSFLDERTVRRLKVLPLYRVKNTLTVAMADPTDVIAMDDIKIKSGFKDIQCVIATPESISEGIAQNYVLGATLKDIIQPIVTKGLPYATSSLMAPHRLTSLLGQPPIVKFVNQMLFDALNDRASDIHVEPFEDMIRIRFRIDGILTEVITLPKEMNFPIVPRIKVISGLDITENRKPQDGRFSISISGRKVDIRVSTFPIVYGESASLRLLDRTAAVLQIEELGFLTSRQDKIKKLIQSPHGIILVTGPTGSGKTTTLYAILNRISSSEKNILTIEDPVEYVLENVNQAQVNPKIGLNFANALRSFLRHDPDVIMIGEIRDKETAQMSLGAALTGHLVLSTMHANDAVSAIPRLEDLGVARNMLAPSVICSLAQRLVRQICPDCKAKYSPNKKLIADLGSVYDLKTKFYKGKGCPKCHSTGYRGRVGIFELLVFTDEIRVLLQKDSSLEKIKKTAVKSGMKTLLEDGLDKVAAGVTTIEEVARVTQDSVRTDY